MPRIKENLTDPQFLPPSVDQAPLRSGELPIVHAIRHGQHAEVERLLGSNNLDINAVDDQGLTAMNHAVLSGDQRMIVMVLGHKMGKSIEEATTLIQDTNLGDPARKSAVALETALNQLNPRALPPLHAAALMGDVDAVKSLLEAGADAKVITPSHQTVLHFAALSSNRAVMELLLDQNLPIDYPDANGFSALHFAMTREQMFNAQLLIERGANPTLSAKIPQLTPLAVAYALLEKRCNDRDPLKVDWLQAAMFTGLVCSWAAAYCEGDVATTLSLVGVFSNTIPLAVALQRTWRNPNLALLANVILPRIPVVGTAFDTYKAYNISKAALSNLGTCWRNAGLEWYRPLRNGVLGAATLTSAWKGLAVRGWNFQKNLQQPGFLSRFVSFMPQCLSSGESYDTCEAQLNDFEATRAATGVRWEDRFSEMPARREMFDPLCEEEFNSEYCGETFWRLEKSKYFEGIDWDHYFKTEFPGAQKRYLSLQMNWKLIDAELGNRIAHYSFEKLEASRYVNGLRWEEMTDGMVERWHAYNEAYFPITLDRQDRLDNFFGLELQRQQGGAKFEEGLAGLKARWDMFRPTCQSEIATSNETFCPELLVDLESIRYGRLDGGWEKLNWDDSLIGAGARQRNFVENCEQTALKSTSCVGLSSRFEVARIYGESTSGTSFDGMSERWQRLWSTSNKVCQSKERCLQIFWELERERALTGNQWAKNIRKAWDPQAAKAPVGSALQAYQAKLFPEDINIRYDSFQTVWEDTLGKMKSASFNTGRELFLDLEKERLLGRGEWKTHFADRIAGTEERRVLFDKVWANFSGNKIGLNKENVFWNHLEKNRYITGHDWRDKFNESESYWTGNAERFERLNLSRDERLEELWTSFLLSPASSRHSPESGPVPINPADFEGMTVLERLTDDRLDSGNVKHAEVMLKLGSDWTRKDLKMVFNALSKQVHPDRTHGDEEPMQRLGEAYRVLKDTL